MITTKEVKIKIPEDFTSEYIENELDKMGFTVLRWAITDIDNDYCNINVSVVSK